MNDNETEACSSCGLTMGETRLLASLRDGQTDIPYPNDDTLRLVGWERSDGGGMPRMQAISRYNAIASFVLDGVASSILGVKA